MERRDGRGRPGAPNSQQESPSPKRQKEKIANNSPVSPVERKLSDKLSLTQAGDKKIENVGLSKTRGVVFDCKEGYGWHERHNQGRPNQPEQQPHGGGVNKPELHPPKELPLHFEPNLPSHEQQTDDLDPKLEDAIRAYAMGDPEEEARLREQAKNDPILQDGLLHPGGGLAYGPHPPLKTKKD